MNQLQQRWKQYTARIDALSLRERAMVAGAAAAGIVFLAYTAMIEPANLREQAANAAISQQRMQMAAIDLELQQKNLSMLADPDQGTRERLNQLRRENERMRHALRSMQKGLVAPDKIGRVLEQMLGTSRLKLVSLRTLAPRGMSDGKFTEPEGSAPLAASETQRVAQSVVGANAPASGQAAAQAPVTPELLYRHGVQIELQGSYLDLLAYMEALERMPSQLFWGKAELRAENHPTATLSLTLYTLSLDQTWIAL